MLRLKELYKKEIIPALKSKFGHKNAMAVCKAEKIVINVGIGKIKDEPKTREMIEQTLITITGQKPAVRVAKKAISGFKVRKNDPCGLVVTLRGSRMYDLLEKITKVVYPRTKDFRGIKESCIDAQGNLNLGLREQVVFPEIKQERIEKTHSLQVTICTNAATREEAKKYFQLIGFLFQNK